MPRQFALTPTLVTHDPTQRMDTMVGKLPAFDPVKLAEALINLLTEHLEDIPVLGVVVKALRDLLDTDDDGQIELEDLLGVFTGRGVLDALASLWGGGAGLPFAQVFAGLGAMFGGLTPGGQFDASKLIGQLPAGIVSFLRAIFGGLLGNIELGQLIRPNAGQERNWLGTFDDPESVPPGDGFEHDATVGRTRPGSAKLTFDGAAHLRTSEPIDAAPAQPMDLGGYVRFDGYTGTGGPAVALRVLAYNAGDQLIGSQQIGTVTPSGPTSANFETVMQTLWTAPANTAYVYVRMEGLAAGTAGTAHFDDLWLRKPAQSLPQEWVNGLVSALSNLGDGISDAWDFVQNVIDKFMNGRGILGSLFSLSHFETEVAKVFGPGSSIPQGNVDGLGGALAALLPKTDWTKFLNGFTDAGNNGTAPSTGIPALDGLINSFLGVRTTATGAQDTATAVQGTVQQQAVTMGTVDGLTVVYTQITSTQTWNRSAIPAGCTERVKTGVGLVGSGQGGSKPSRSSKQAAYGTSGNTGSYFECPSAPGGVGGGYIYAEFDPATVGASQTVTIGAGGAGATSNGAAGSYGGTTSFGSLLSIASGAGGGVSTSLGIALAGGAGRGGAGGMATGYVNSIGANVSVYDDNGKQGDPAYRVQGGSGGTGNGGNGGAGQNAPTDDSFLTGGSGGGGGSAGGSSGGAGGAGGVPGGGGGAGGGANPGSPGNGGAGGRGEALIAEYFR